MVDGEAHPGPVTVDVGSHGVLGSGQKHAPLVHPVVDGTRMRFRQTLKGHVGVGGRSDQLVRHEDHRRN